MLLYIQGWMDWDWDGISLTSLTTRSPDSDRNILPLCAVIYKKLAKNIALTCSDFQFDVLYIKRVTCKAAWFRHHSVRIVPNFCTNGAENWAEIETGQCGWLCHQLNFHCIFRWIRNTGLWQQICIHPVLFVVAFVTIKRYLRNQTKGSHYRRGLEN